MSALSPVRSCCAHHRRTRELKVGRGSARNTLFVLSCPSLDLITFTVRFTSRT